jgi:hypothetical protein
MAAFIPAFFSALAPMVGPIVDDFTGTGKAKAAAAAAQAKAVSTKATADAAIEKSRAAAVAQAGQTSAKMVKTVAIAGGFVVSASILGLVVMNRKGRKA